MSAPMGRQQYAATSVVEWKQSEEYHNSFLIRPDEVLEGTQKRSSQNRPRVSMARGKFLNLLVRTHGAKKVLEIGTVGGLSTIWLAQGLPEDGTLLSLDVFPNSSQMAREDIHAAGISDKVEIEVGPAAEALAKLEPPFDIVFINTDEPSDTIYYKEAKRLVRKGGVIIIVNDVWADLSTSAEHSDPKRDGIKELLEAMKGDPDVDATTIGTVGNNGCDGFIYMVRN